ncbi:hypothetical protein EDD22DRAFT_904408 [Suillus occidentalis]|nr:hypothetical protein EDD22DRAFT_904408 [Suillus occidentalis]
MLIICITLYGWIALDGCCLRPNDAECPQCNIQLHRHFCLLQAIALSTTTPSVRMLVSKQAPTPSIKHYMAGLCWADAAYVPTVPSVRNAIPSCIGIVVFCKPLRSLPQLPR